MNCIPNILGKVQLKLKDKKEERQRKGHFTIDLKGNEKDIYIERGREKKRENKNYTRVCVTLPRVG